MSLQIHSWKGLRAAILLAASVTFSTLAAAQVAATIPHTSASPTVISLAAPTQPRAAAIPGEPTFENSPPNFHAFASARVGEETGVETLTLNFSGSTKLTGIDSKAKDFIVEPGGSCHEGNAYSAGQSCTLQVRFSPQSAGTRTSKIYIQHTASATPLALGIGGYGYAPVLSFTPAVISTVTGTYPSNAGLMNGALNLTVDGNDTLYVADTGNNLIRSQDSSGNWVSLASGYASPWGIAVDTMGQVYFDLKGSNYMYEIYDYGPVVQITGTATGACTAATPCTLGNHAISTPGTMSIDRYNNLFFVDADAGAAMSTVQPVPATLIYLYDPFPYQTTPSSPIVVDNNDNIYSAWSNGGTCSIMQSSLYNAENSKVIFNKVAGGHTCGFAGDGGQAGNAEIGAKISQMVFDLYGNLYFTDTSNNRVRRIDSVTGQINTIAGTGTAGYSGDGGAATSATLSAPTGVGVDSLGQVYILSNAPTAGPTQVLRKIGPNGYLNFGSQIKGTPSAAKTVTVSNTGNSGLVMTNAVITGANASDFAIDPTTTSCQLIVNATLAAGQSCKIGFIFNPAATGTRTASLVLNDNTVTSSNIIQLTGNGLTSLPSPTMTVAWPGSGANITTGSALGFKVTLAGSPTPTGTVTMTLDGVTVSGSPATIASGLAYLYVSTAVIGSHTLKAVYNGDSNWAAGATASVTYNVVAAAAKCGTCVVGHPEPISTGPHHLSLNP